MLARSLLSAALYRSPILFGLLSSKIRAKKQLPRPVAMSGNGGDEICEEVSVSSWGSYDDAFVPVGIGEVCRFQEIDSLLRHAYCLAMAIRLPYEFDCRGFI